MPRAAADAAAFVPTPVPSRGAADAGPAFVPTPVPVQLHRHPLIESYLQRGEALSEEDRFNADNEIQAVQALYSAGTPPSHGGNACYQPPQPTPFCQIQRRPKQRTARARQFGCRNSVCGTYFHIL